jgi:hypothetical protein
MKKTVRPVEPETIVRDPVTKKPLAAEGEAKEIGQYWLRRIIEKSVEVIPEPTTVELTHDEEELDYGSVQ